MSRCPISFTPCSGRYSEAGLKSLHPRLKFLADFPYSAEEQVREAAGRASKMSIQGVQPKLSAVLSLKKSIFEVVDTGGLYILKPQNPLYPELPENEALTMRMAASAGIETPLNGLIYCRDGSLTYFIRRFDRIGRKQKLGMEDFSQLMGLTRETKYDGSMEGVARIVDRHCTFPALERIKLFRLTVFCWMTGNEDMHLKNFSLITRNDTVTLSPAYDLLNTSIAVPNASEELALPLKGKKRKLTGTHLVDYFGKERLQLSDKSVASTLAEISSAREEWERLVRDSFLSEKMKTAYLRLLASRRERFGDN